MATKGPDAHFDHGFAFPVRVEGDSSIVWDETSVVVFRWGTPGPVEGVLAVPLGEVVLGVTGARTAIGTVPASETAIDPALVYGYNVSVGEGEARYLVVHGRLTVGLAVPGS